MTRPAPTSLASSWLSSVSHGMVDYWLEPVIYGFRLEVDYVVTREDIFLGSVSAFDPAMGFLERVRLWLKLFFMEACEPELAPAKPLQPGLHERPANRRSRRRAKRALPIARSSYALGNIILRRWGYKRFVQWLYNCTLTSRAKWCFRAAYRGVRGRTSLGALLAKMAPAFCAAQLRPD